MADHVDITLWIDRRWKNAIEKHLKDETLQEHLDSRAAPAARPRRPARPAKPQPREEIPSALAQPSNERTGD